MFATKFTTAFLFALASSVSANPINVGRGTLAIWDPTILTPDSQTVWVRGQTAEVTWDTSNPPANVTNPIGQIHLAKGGNQGYGVLASGFPLTDGRVQVTVPSDLEPASDYQVVLFGDSGNVSPEFSVE